MAPETRSCLAQIIVASSRKGRRAQFVGRGGFRHKGSSIKGSSIKGCSKKGNRNSQLCCPPPNSGNEATKHTDPRGLNYQRCHAGWPCLTATKTPFPVAVNSSSAQSSARVETFLSVLSSAQAISRTDPVVGVGLLKRTENSEVTEQGGLSKPIRCISVQAAVQFM